MDYLSVFVPYILEELKAIPLTLMKTTKTLITDYHPCFNIQRDEDVFIYMMILLLKNLILSHGIIRVLPKYVSLVTFPSLVFLHYYFRATREPVACILNMFSFSVIWSLVFQFDYTIEAKYAFAVVLSTLGVAVLERGFCGFQFATDMFVLLILVWCVLNSLFKGKFYITFLIIACSQVYFKMFRGSEDQDSFYVYLLLCGWGLLNTSMASQGTQEENSFIRGTQEEKVFLIAVSLVISILLCYNIAVYGFSGPIHGELKSFSRLPPFDSLVLAILERGFSGFQFAIDMFMILILVWCALNSLWNGKFYITFFIIACSQVYFNVFPSSEDQDSFYVFLILCVWGLLSAFIFSRGTREERMFLITVSSVIGIWVCFTIAMYGFSGPIHGRPKPFNRLPAFDHAFFDAMKSKEFYHNNLAEEHKNLDGGVHGPLTEEEMVLEQQLMLAGYKAPTTKSTIEQSAAKPEVESIVYTPDADGAPDFKAGMRVKYRPTKEKMLREQKVPFEELKAPTTESTTIEQSTSAKPEVESIVYTEDADGAPDFKAGVRVKYRATEKKMLREQKVLIEAPTTKSTSTVEQSTTPKPEVESIVYTQDADGAPDLGAGVRVKYRSNEKKLY